jgi:hypothetical protein
MAGRGLLLLGGAALAVAAVAGMAGGAKTPEQRLEAARVAVKKKFAVSADCSSVEFTGNPDKANVFWAGPMERFLEMVIALYAISDLDPLNLSNEAMGILFKEECGGMPPRTASWETLYRAIELKIGSMLG